MERNSMSYNYQIIFEKLIKKLWALEMNNSTKF
jgi:hypothetical protein